MWGLRRFWKDWYRRYYDNFKWNDKKNIVLNTKVSTRPLTIKRKDIITGYDIDVKVVSKAEQEANRQEERTMFAVQLQLMLQDPSLPSISRKMALRKNARLNGMTHEEAMLFVPADVNEELAMDHVDILNDNELPDIREAAQDPFTFRVIAHRAIPTKAKFAYIEALKLLERQLGTQTSEPVDT